MSYLNQLDNQHFSLLNMTADINMNNRNMTVTYLLGGIHLYPSSLEYFFDAGTGYLILSAFHPTLMHFIHSHTIH